MFIPIAEKNGTIVPIGAWVVDESIRIFSQWKKDYRIPMILSLNISAIQYNRDDFVDMILNCLKKYDLDPNFLELEITESVFIEMITKIFTQDLRLPFIGGVFLCGILAAIMSTADSQLLVTASSVSKDIYKDILKPQADEKTVLKVSRVTVIVVAVMAFAIAWNPNNSIMGLVSDAWAGLGSAFGPIVLMSLFWRRTNFAGAVAGIVSGGLTVIIWDYIPFINGQTLGTATGLYSLATGFVISILCIVIFSLCTKAPEKEILEEFDRVKKMKEEKKEK